MSQVVGLPDNSYKPITNTTCVHARLCKLYKKGCTRLAAASDKVYQLLAHGRWFSLGTLASSTTKTGRHDIAEILLKVALNTIKIKSIIHIYTKHTDACNFICMSHFKKTFLILSSPSFLLWFIMQSKHPYMYMQIQPLISIIHSCMQLT